MPRIPRFQSNVTPPGLSGGVPMSPEIAGVQGKALSAFGDEIQRTGKIFEQIKEKEDLAHDTIEATKLESALKTSQLEIAQTLEGRTDYQNFEPEIEKKLEDLKSSLSPKGASQRLSLAFERSYQTSAFHLQTVAKTKKWQAMEIEGKIAFGDIIQQSFEDWKNATPEERKIIETETRLKGQALAKNNAVDLLWVEEALDKYEEKAQQYTIDAVDVAVDQDIMKDPIAARLKLEDSTYQPDLPIKIRQDKKEKAEVAIRVKEQELERKEKKAKEEAANKIESDVTDNILKGDLSTALGILKSKDAKVIDEVRSGARRSLHHLITQMPKQLEREARAEARDDRQEERMRLAELKSAAISDVLNRIYNPDENRPISEPEILSVMLPVDPTGTGATRMISEYRKVKNTKDPYFSKALSKIKDYEAKGLFSADKKKNAVGANKAINGLYALREQGVTGAAIDVELEKVIETNKHNWKQSLLNNIVNGYNFLNNKTEQKEQPAQKTVVKKYISKSTGKTKYVYSDGSEVIQ